MKTVLHIFLKDVRQTRRLLVLWLALLATQLASCLAEKQTNIADWDFLLAEGPKLPIWTLLHWIGLVGLVFEVLLADRAFGPEPCWKTRPIARWQMAIAKLGFVTVFTVLLPCALEFFAFTGQGIPVDDAMLELAFAVPTQAFVVGWMVMLACVSRKKTMEVVVLAPMSVAAPFLVAGSMGWLTERLRESDSFGFLLDRSWTSPPDYLEQPLGFLIGCSLVWAVLPIVVGTRLVWFAYLHGVRRRAVVVLVGLAGFLTVVPVLLLMAATMHGEPIPVAATHLKTAAEVGWNAKWKVQAGRTNYSWLETNFRLPELTNGTGGPLLPEHAHGWATIAGRRSGSSRWEELFPVQCAVTELDHYVNLVLAHTNSPLGRALSGPVKVLNPPTGSGAAFGAVNWWDQRPLTRWSEAKLTLRLELLERELHIVRRTDYRNYEAERLRAIADMDLADGEAEPVRNVQTATTFLKLPFLSDSARGSAPQKAVLWHPKRHELLLPTTTLSAQRRHCGVLALSDLWRVQVLKQRSDFPRVEKLLPASDITDREWFAEAELLLLAFKPVTNRHHIILVPDATLPPVEGKP